MTALDIYDRLFTDYPALNECKNDIISAFTLLSECAKADAKVLVCGNGGSAADSEHIVGELMKGFLLKRPLSEEQKKPFSEIEGGEEIANKLQCGIKAISLVSQSGVISAFANDIDPSLVYAQQVFAYADKKEDVLIALSTSGNSDNIVKAAKTAKAAGIKTIAITGAKESKLSAIADCTIKTPSTQTYQIQEYTLPVYHALCAMLEADMFTR